MPHVQAADPAPLTPPQIRALVGAAGRQLSWGLPAAASAARRWRERAEAIPDGPIRDDALYALTRKRGHRDGAALFAVLVDRRDRDLLELLVAYEMIWDFLDNVSERHSEEANGRELHLALVDALDPGRPLADYYRHHPWSEDAGYLRSLVEFCRSRCLLLPSYDKVRRLVLREAWRAQVQALNHIEPPEQRDAALRRWADEECPGERELAWFELSGAASASLVVHALLSLAADPDVDQREIDQVHAAYWPRISLATTMLDSYVDRVEDVAAGNHSYIDHYLDQHSALDRLCECVGRAARMARDLPNGRRHALIMSCMVAMYLSKDSARLPDTAPGTRRIADAGGSMARLLVPVLRAWRVATAQQAH